MVLLCFSCFGGFYSSIHLTRAFLGSMLKVGNLLGYQNLNMFDINAGERRWQLAGDGDSQFFLISSESRCFVTFSCLFVCFVSCFYGVWSVWILSKLVLGTSYLCFGCLLDCFVSTNLVLLISMFLFELFSDQVQLLQSKQSNS